MKSKIEKDVVKACTLLFLILANHIDFFNKINNLKIKAKINNNIII